MPRAQVVLRPASLLGVFDSFNRTDTTGPLGNADTGQLWQAYSGVWGISGNRGYRSSGSGQDFASLNSLIWSGTADADVTIPATGEAGLVIRHNGLLGASGSWLFVTASNLTGLVQVTKYNVGVFDSTVASVSYAWGTDVTRHLKVVFLGSTVEVSIDGVVVISVTAAYYQTNGWHGLTSNSNSAFFNDFRVVEGGRILGLPDTGGGPRFHTPTNSAWLGII